MNDHILNLINQLLCYSDPAVTDNPHERAFDHRRRLECIAVKNPAGDSRMLAPGESFSLVQNIVASGLQAADQVSIDLVGAEDSIYRLSVLAEPNAFRTQRSVTGITTCAVTINNQSVAVFDFAGVAFTQVQVGDYMRIKGQSAYDDPPYAFNPINSGAWKVIGISGTKISAVREVGTDFAAVAESITDASNDVIFYADDKIRNGMKFQITDTFSPVTRRTYEVLESTPTFIDFVSTQAIPEESMLSYIDGSIVFYTGVKRMIYLEADQEVSVRFNGQTDDKNVVTPIVSGDKVLRGSLLKWGDTYSCEVVNLSVNGCSIKFFTVE